uniref:TLDc domain-containing protein n=1 Tax=Rhodosorus marinus TaxID=101924 RepID=A0A7S2ZQV6_9RHOD
MSCSFVGGVDGIIRLGGDHRAGFCRRRSRRVVMREKDLGEKLFGLIFGKQEETPLGFQRFDRDRFPEQYEATLDEFADPVASDTEEMALFRPMLARTQLVTRELQLLYDAEEHGWTASAFHECVNKKGAGVVLAVTEGGTVCGGYNPKVGWSDLAYVQFLLLTTLISSDFPTPPGMGWIWRISRFPGFFSLHMAGWRYLETGYKIEESGKGMVSI